VLVGALGKTSRLCPHGPVAPGPVVPYHRLSPLFGAPSLGALGSCPSCPPLDPPLIGSLFPAHCPVLMRGDLNLPNIDWTIDSCEQCADKTCSDAGLFLDLYYNHGLTQFVTEPTRLDSILDLNCAVQR
jgi:hypothetical protein